MPLYMLLLWPLIVVIRHKNRFGHRLCTVFCHPSYMHDLNIIIAQNTSATEDPPPSPPPSDAQQVHPPKQQPKMTAAYEHVAKLYKELSAELGKSASPNLKKCSELLDQLKVALTKLVYLPTGDAKPSEKELLLARDVLEAAVQFSVTAKDIPAFERYMSQLKCYYFDYSSECSESQHKYQLLGLNLLFLLSQNRVSEFHTELELLPQQIIQSNQFIRHPLALEQYLMEGSYNKIFLAKGNGPSPSYTVFMDILLETVRQEIGACFEWSYDKISVAEAGRRLNLTNEAEVKVFADKRKWELRNGSYYFDCKSTKPKEPLPAMDLAGQAIFYARELEMIV